MTNLFNEDAILNGVLQLESVGKQSNDFALDCTLYRIYSDLDGNYSMAMEEMDNGRREKRIDAAQERPGQ